MKILVTGVAGFIGMHVAKKLLEAGHEVCGIDNLNDYYDVGLKKSRLNILQNLKFHFSFHKVDITQMTEVLDIFKSFEFELVIHMAAQAGVRYSIQNPQQYVDTNIKGFINILESCKIYQIDNIIYASSSSVYGNSRKSLFQENDNTNRPESIYAATKKSNELLAFTYSSLYKLKIIGLRFFTVYGPWGRPDMALFKFTNAIFNKEKIDIYNNGKMERDFTYINDVTESINRLVFKFKNKFINNGHQIFNIGSENPIPILQYLQILEQKVGKSAKINFLPKQLGDVIKTSSNSNKLYNFIEYKPKTKIEDGISDYVDWFKFYYKI